MTDRKFNELKKKVENIVDSWLGILGLTDHRISYKFLREYHQDKYTVAQVFPLWQYKHHTIEFFMPSIESSLTEHKSDWDVQEDILHELVHILIAPAAGNETSDNAAKNEMAEYATQSVTHALLRARGLERVANAKI